MPKIDNPEYARYGKDKQISAKVNEIAYKNFTEINRRFGMSNNSVINMLINQYVYQHAETLKEIEAEKQEI